MMYSGHHFNSGPNMQDNNQANSAHILRGADMPETSQLISNAGSGPINLSQPVLHDFVSPNITHMPPQFWRPTSLDFDQNLDFNLPPIVRHAGTTNGLVQKEHWNCIDGISHPSVIHQSGGLDPYPVSTEDLSMSTSSNEGNSYIMATPHMDEQEAVSGVSSVQMTTSGSLPYTSLCLVGTPSSTVAEYQPESVPYQTEGIYTLLESQKGKEVDVEEEAELFNQIKQVLCDLCGKRFESDGALNKHRRHHKGLHPHVCNICGKGFPWKAKLENHMVTHTESTNKPFMCEICGKHFRNYGYLKLHTKTHKVGRMYKCSLCGRELLRLNHLKKHLELKHTKEGIFEGESGKLYTSNEYLNKTMRLSKDKRYESKTCEYCEIDVPDEAAYIIHKKIHLAKGEVKCRYCEKVIYNFAYLQMHEKSHTIVKSHKCDLCGKMFFKFSQLKHHMRTHAWIRKSKCKTVVKLDIQGALKYTENNTCLACEMSFSSFDELQEHNLQHTIDNNTYKCILCTESFNGLDSLSQLRHHMMKHHKLDKPFQCKHCEKSYFQKNQLKCHMKHHSKVKPFKCDQCEESFLRDNQLRIHYAIHTGEKPFPCEECDRRFSSTAALRHHKVIHDENAFFCKLCYKPLSTKSLMDSHMVRVHSGDNLVYCDVCNVPFNKLSYMTVHMQESHKGYVVKGTTKCPKCPRRFVRKSSLKVHMRAHASEMPFRCDVCGKGSVYENNMKTHRKTHFNEAGELNSNPLKCDLCRKLFKRPIDCRKHQMCHSKVQRYKCDLCGKGFAYPHSLKRHKEGHFEIKTKKKPGQQNAVKLEIKEYKCDLCRAKFPIEELLDEHKNSHFDDVANFECPICGDGFRRKGEMKKHQKTHQEIRSDDESDDEMGGGEKIYECDVCEQMFKSVVELKIHDRIHCISPKIDKESSDSSKSDSETSSDDDDKKVEKCGRGRKSVRGRRPSQNNRHLTARPASKLIRGKSFKNRRPLFKRGASRGRVSTVKLAKVSGRKKEKKQTKARVRYECNQCDAHFAKISRLKNHIKNHRDVKPLVCVVCNEVFWNNKTLEIHLESHLGSVFRCDVCAANFTHYIDLDNHLAASHASIIKKKGRPKKKPFSCSKCRMCFSTIEHLEAHKMMHIASVRLKRETYNSNLVRLVDVEPLLQNVKHEADETIEPTGSFSSEQESRVKEEQIQMPNNQDLSSGAPADDFEPPEIADVRSLESPEQFPPPDISSSHSTERQEYFVPQEHEEVADVLSPESPEQFHQPERSSSHDLEYFDPPEIADVPSLESLEHPDCPRIEVGLVPKASEDSVPDSDKCFKCSVCDNFFAKSSSLEHHIMMVHMDNFQPASRFHLVQETSPPYACVHINSTAKSCSKSFDDL